MPVLEDRIRPYRHRQRMGRDREYFSGINFSSVNEDWRTEARALQLEGDDVVLCVTGSGDRPLDLLAQAEPRRIVAIDRDPAQNELLRLKMAAIESLDYEEYVRFLGLREAPPAERLDTFQQLAPSLRPESASFWRAHTDELAHGVLYAGRFERYFAKVSYIARLLRGPVIERLFQFEDIDKQRPFVDDIWDRRWWRYTFRVLLHPLVSRVLYGDPAYFAHVDVRVGSYLYDAMTRFLRRHPARESFMLHLIFRGRLPDHDLPPYLTRQGVATLRDRLNRIDVRTADVVEHLNSVPSETYSRYSLSDLPSYLSQDAFARLLEGVQHSARPDARIVIRQFLTDYDLPDSVRERLSRDRRLEHELAATDRAFAYRFIVANWDPNNLTEN